MHLTTNKENEEEREHIDSVLLTGNHMSQTNIYRPLIDPMVHETVQIYVLYCTY